MQIERWLVLRMHDWPQWRVEPYAPGQKKVETRFSSVQLAATALADGAPVSIEGPSALALGEYAIIRIERSGA